MGRKHCGKRRNCLLQAISPFPSVFKRLVSQGVSKGVIVWEWVKQCFTLFPTLFHLHKVPSAPIHAFLQFLLRQPMFLAHLSTMWSRGSFVVIHCPTCVVCCLSYAITIYLVDTLEATFLSQST